MFSTFSKWWGIECTSSQSVSKDTLFQARRSHCLSSSSVFGAGSLYVVSSTIIQMVSKFTSREFPDRSPFAIKFANPSDTMSACAPPFSLQRFPTFVSYVFILLCSKLWSCKVEFFYLSVLKNYYAYSYSFFDNISHTFKKQRPSTPCFIF